MSSIRPTVRPRNGKAEEEDGCKRKPREREVQPNSSLGKAIAYMSKTLGAPDTLFLRVPGAPLDNNLCEQVLKQAILHRKNWLLLRTKHRAILEFCS